MIPVVDNNHVNEALALLTDMFKTKPVIQGFVNALADDQDLEDAAWGLINGIILATAVGNVLDQYGKILLVNRDGRSDNDYRKALQLEIRVLRSNGLSEDVIQVAALALSSFQYDEWPPAAFTIFSNGVTGATAILDQIGRTRAAATRGVFLFSLSGTDLIWGSTIGSVPTATGFSDLVSGMFPDNLVSSQDFIK